MFVNTIHTSGKNCSVTGKLPLIVSKILHLCSTMKQSAVFFVFSYECSFLCPKYCIYWSNTAVYSSNNVENLQFWYCSTMQDFLWRVLCSSASVSLVSEVNLLLGSIYSTWSRSCDKFSSSHFNCIYTVPVTIVLPCAALQQGEPRSNRAGTLGRSRMKGPTHLPMQEKYCKQWLSL